jgi:uncharacterized protein
MKIWIDLSNSPHPLLFAPVARRLEELGDAVRVTARDNAQTVELARGRWPGVEVVGEPSPGARVAKARALAARVKRLRSWARRERPDVALSHNSYAQIVAARTLGIPAVTAMDFEHQPANHLAFRLAKRILLPEAFPAEAARRQGARDSKVRRYAGLKEGLYLGDFEPDPDIVARLGIEVPAGGALVVTRTPPSRALYHHFGNPLFLACLRAVTGQRHVRCVVLPRHPEELAWLERLSLSDCTIARSAVDSRSLMYRADLVLGAGGTMTREAALLGVPTVSLFAGRVPAVDLWLERRGMLRRIDSADEFGEIAPRARPARPLSELRGASEGILQNFVMAARSASVCAPAG